MRIGAALLLLLGACQVPAEQGSAAARERPDVFPKADRPVAKIVSSRWSTEEARDRLREADEVMNRAGIVPGMTVADIGAGDTEGELQLDSDPDEPGELLLDFDPRGELVEVRQGGTVYLELVMPD